MSDRRQELTEAQIGIQVFGRAETYNPGEDSIVRVSARHLRLKLGEYFQSEGANEQFGLEIPKGSYFAVFAHRNPSRPPETQTPTWAPAMPSGAPPVPIAAAPEKHNPHLFRFVALAAIVSLSALSLWLWGRPLANATSPDTLARLVLTASPRHTMLVLSDTGLIVAEKITLAEPRIQDYVSGGYRQALAAQFAEKGGPPELARHLGVTQHTGIADAAIYGRVLRAHPDLMSNLTLRHARGITPRDIQADNVILIGGPRSNPWTKLFADQMSFEQGYDPQSQTGFIVNRQPIAGEQSRYADDLPAGIGFGHIAFLPNFSGDGRVLMIGGTTMSAKEAAGEFVTDPIAYQQLLKSLKLASLNGPHVLEVIIQCTGLGGSARDWRVVTHRLKQADLSRRYKQ